MVENTENKDYGKQYNKENYLDFDK